MLNVLKLYEKNNLLAQFTPGPDRVYTFGSSREANCADARLAPCQLRFVFTGGNWHVEDASGDGSSLIGGAPFFRHPVLASLDVELKGHQFRLSAAGSFEADITFTYCTEFIVARDKGNDRDPLRLRAYLESIGDCVVVVDDEEIIKVHVHTNDPGKALSEGVKYGQFETVKVENMRIQHANAGWVEETGVGSEPAAPVRAEPEEEYGFVAVAAGEGLQALFNDLGCSQVVSGGQTMNPSTDDILREIDATPAEVVFVLPNNKNIIMAAEQCVRLVEGKQVVVLPTKTIPQGISALMVMDPEAEVEDNRAAMAEAIGWVHTSEITYAARDSDFDGFAIKRGDYLALTEHQLFGTDRKLEKLLRRLAEAEAQQSAEFINIFYGEDVSEKEAQKALKLFTECCPNAEITLLSGGQPVYYYMISAE